ncbi:MAG TPA: putative Fe-S cluster assembly protein SufT [Candidatus Limnocylindrales bacterium]|nr:putative Fe-S cluster assembly protein SufT [Candidatus Limnocylindrales bacterium]
MERLDLTRDTQAVRIPMGDRIELAKGTEVYVTQSLGGSFTVQAPAYGGLFRIAGLDADALGKDVPEEARVLASGEGPIEDLVTAALRTCYDPEIPVNIVDLGLVYDTRITEAGEGRYRVDVKMTLTATGCGMGTSIAGDAEEKLRSIPSVAEAHVGIVWDPPWNPQMISEEGRRKLGIG